MKYLRAFFESLSSIEELRKDRDGVEYSGNRDFIKFEFYKSYPSED